MTDSARISALEEAVRFMAETISSQGGEIQSLQAALCGILVVTGKDAEVRAQVTRHFERCTALNLGSSQNQPQVDAFTSSSEVLRLAMNEHRERYGS